MQNFLTTIGFGDFRAETMEQKIFFIVICVPGHTLTTAMLTQLADQAMGLLHSGRRVGRNSKRRMKVPSFVLSLSLSLHSIFPFCSLRDHLSLSLSPSGCLCLSLISLSRAPHIHSLFHFRFPPPLTFQDDAFDRAQKLVAKAPLYSVGSGARRAFSVIHTQIERERFEEDRLARRLADNVDGNAGSIAIMRQIQVRSFYYIILIVSNYLYCRVAQPFYTFTFTYLLLLLIILCAIAA